MNNRLYNCLIEEPDAEEAFFQNYWARASHMGEAIQMMLEFGREEGLRNPIPRKCDPFDIEYLDDEVRPGAEADVFCSTCRHTYPPEEPAFKLPVGIIASGVQGEHEVEHDADEIVPGYTQRIDEDGLIGIDVNVESQGLFPLYRALVRLHPEYKLFWYVLHGHWDDEAEGAESEESEDMFLVNQELNSPEKILIHLRDRWADSIQNGFLTLTAYLGEGQTNLTISDHKRIAVSTFSSAVAEEYRRVLEASGYLKLEDRISIEYERVHYHYRVRGSRSRGDLEATLRESGFTDWSPKEKS